MNARDREQAYSSLYGEHSAEYVKQQDFLLPLLALQPGCLLLVMLDSQTAAGLGEVVGGYQFQSDSKLPHQVPIRWFTTEGFDIQHGQGQREGLHPVQPKEQLAAEMEAAWLVLTQPKSFEEFQQMFKDTSYQDNARKRACVVLFNRYSLLLNLHK